MLSHQKAFIQVVQNILVFGYGCGCGVSSAVNLVKNTGITPQDCFLCLQLCSFAHPPSPHGVERNPPGTCNSRSRKHWALLPLCNRGICVSRNHLRPSDLVRQLLLILGLFWSNPLVFELKLNNQNISTHEGKCPCEIASNGL